MLYQLNSSLGKLQTDNCERLQFKIGEVGRTLKALIKSLGKTLNPLNLGILEPFPSTNLKENLKG